MITAKKADRELIIEILMDSFEFNKSVNYIISNNSRKSGKMRQLMAYSVDVCQEFGNVFLTQDLNGCALVLNSKKKSYNLKRLWWDLKLLLFGVGFRNLRKVLRREKIISRIKGKAPHTYLWFIGVKPEAQHEGIGSRLLMYILEKARSENLPLYLETSTEQNLPWYESQGFEVYSTYDFSYRLYFLRKI